MRHKPTVSALAAALLAGLGLAPLAADAATIFVNTAGDSGGAGDCTLRQAIVTMNDGATAGANEGNCRAIANTLQPFGLYDTINFDSGVFPVGGANTIVLQNNLLSITAPRLNITGMFNGNVTIDAGHASRVMFIYNTGSNTQVVLDHLTLVNGNPNLNDQVPSKFYGFSGGGGILAAYSNVVLSNCTVSGNSVGGGIYAIGSALSLSHSTVSGNGGGSGITIRRGTLISTAGRLNIDYSTISGNSSGSGIYVYQHSAAHITNSTISGNSPGGGIAIDRYSSAYIANSTISGNLSSLYGGGIWAVGGLIMLQSTVANNTATDTKVCIPNRIPNCYYRGGKGGGIFMSRFGGGSVGDSIVAGNTQRYGSNIYNASSNFALLNVITSTVGLNLGPLQDNGGPTLTMLPGPGSTAIDAAPCYPMIFDQRGVVRPQGAACDIGAVEVQQPRDRIFSNGFGPPPGYQ